MNLELPSDIENLLSQRAAQSGMTAQQFALLALQEKIAEEEVVVAQEDHSTWITQLRAWSNDHPRGTHFVDDSRESIYGDRGH